MENRAEQNFSPITGHNDAVNTHGLDDLFQWASDTMADGLDGRARRVREQLVKRQVLNIIHRSADLQAKAKHADELAYLHRRVIALQGALGERTEEVMTLKQVVQTQYYSLNRIPELEEQLVQQEALHRLNDKAAEESRRHLMSALTRLKEEKELLDELVTVNESENARLVVLLNDARKEITTLQNRRWWHFFFPPIDELG